MCLLKKVPLADVQSGSDNERQEQRELSAEPIKGALESLRSSLKVGQNLPGTAYRTRISGKILRHKAFKKFYLL